MKKSDKNKSNQRKLQHSIRVLIIIVMTLLIWQLLSSIYTPLILPSPVVTAKTLLKIMKEQLFLDTIFSTFRRLLIGIFASITIGSLLGILMGCSTKMKTLFEPLVYLVQATPPILYMTLAMIWFGLNGSSTIFIVFMGSAPVMVVNVTEGFENIDTKLIEMGKAFKFSKFKMMVNIVIPSLKTYFKTGLITVFSFGWKLVIMGEVLSSSTGLGAQITDARMNLETDKVFAWGIIVVLFCFLFQYTTSKIFEFKPKRRKKYERESNIEIFEC